MQPEPHSPTLHLWSKLRGGQGGQGIPAQAESALESGPVWTRALVNYRGPGPVPGPTPCPLFSESCERRSRPHPHPRHNDMEFPQTQITVCSTVTLQGPPSAQERPAGLVCQLEEGPISDGAWCVGPSVRKQIKTVGQRILL